MTGKQKVAYGLWLSPISPGMQGARLRLDDIQFDSDGSLAWLESLSGKTALMYKKGADAPKDISGGLKISGGVGYGGGEFNLRGALAVFASENRLYRVSVENGLPQPITPAFGGCASPTISPDGSQVIFIHTYERADCLALVNIDGMSWPVKLTASADFYMQPAWHPDGQRIAWIEWDHPQMPWDGTRLKMAHLSGSELKGINLVYGSKDIPVFQPSFSPDGRYLAFLANDGEWDTLHLLDLTTGEKRVLVRDASLIDPAWIQGLRLFAWSADSGRIYYLMNNKGWRTLCSLDVTSGETHPLDVAPYTWLIQLSASPVSEKLAFIASSAKITARVVTLEDGQLQIEKRSTGEAVPLTELPEVEPIEWSAPDGTVVHGLFYPPTSTRFFSDGVPPAIVSIHGGPTSAEVSSYNPDAAYFSTRGYAFLEVNYRGSTGYGRNYRLKLREKWGLIDTEDAIGAAKALAALGLADPERMIIMGGSSGGYAVLNALIQFPGVFKAGVNLYGVANLFDLLTDTHKFEERYTDSLVGVLPQASAKFKAWSPIFHVNQIKDPLAVFQGEDDKVVVPAHSEKVVAALRSNKVPHLYKLYPGEGHGFRKTETIIDFYESLENFLQQYVIF